MKVELTQLFHLESARSLPKLPESHPCRRVHGHSFRVALRFVGEVDPTVGWLLDYNEISRRADPVLKKLDHRMLNEVPGLENPTSENIAFYLFENLRGVFPELIQVRVSETPATDCAYPVLSL